MTANKTTDEDTTGTNEMSLSRYEGLKIGNDEYVVYDPENSEAWIQSAGAMDIED